MMLYECLKWLEIHKKRGSTRAEWEAHLQHLRYSPYEPLERVKQEETKKFDHSKESASFDALSG